jgi:hypothetical protein
MSCCCALQLGGGNGPVFAPLSNVLFADIGKAVNGNGSIITPFNELAAMVAALQPLVADGGMGYLTPGTYNEFPLDIGDGFARLASFSGFRDVSANFMTSEGGALLLRGFSTSFITGGGEEPVPFGNVELENCQITTGEAQIIIARNCEIVTSITAANFFAFGCTFQSGATLDVGNLVFDFESFRSAVANVNLVDKSFTVENASLERFDFGASQVGETPSFALPWDLNFSSPNENLTTQLPVQRNSVLTRLYVQFETPLDGGTEPQIATFTVRINGADTSAVLVITGPEQSGAFDMLISANENDRVSVSLVGNVAVIDNRMRIAIEYMQARTVSFQVA